MPRPEIQILVCTNDRGPASERPCCAAGGGLGVYRRLKDRVRELGLKNRVLVTRTGCLRHCSRGVTVVTWPGGHWYGHVAERDADEILEAELAGAFLERLQMPEGPWE